MTRANPNDMLEAIQTAAKVGTDRGGIELTEWEEQFIESIEGQLDKKRQLSERRLEILEKLYDKT